MSTSAQTVDKNMSAWLLSQKQTNKTVISAGEDCSAKFLSRDTYGPRVNVGSDNVGRRKYNYEPPPPYSVNPDISVQYELEFNKDVIKPGDKIKFRGIRGTFVFIRLAHNQRIDSTWIDCVDPTTRGTRSFHVGKLKAVVRPKKSRRKKVVNASV